MKNAVQNLIKKIGFEIHRINGRGTLGGALEQLARKGFSPKYVIDGGASDGRWSRKVQNYFPNAMYVLVEPLEEYRAALAGVPHSRTVIAAIGEANGQSDFYVVNAFNSSRKEVEGTPKRTVQMMTLDSLIEEPEHTLVKLDLEQTEGPVISASVLLSQIPVVIVECSLEMMQDYCARMRQKGFVVYYVYDLNYRQEDGAMSQVDIVFVPIHSRLRELSS